MVWDIRPPQSLGPSALAMILPFLSSIKVVGIELRPNFLPASPQGSKSAEKDNRFSLKKSSTVSGDSLRLTAIILNGSVLYRLYSFCMEGISSRQGGHHVAQKFRNTMAPL